MKNQAIHPYVVEWSNETSDQGEKQHKTLQQIKENNKSCAVAVYCTYNNSPVNFLEIIKKERNYITITHIILLPALH